jgi:hypothetical protein
MSPRSPQNFRNHARYVPVYHFVLAPILGALLVRSGIRLASHPSADTAFGFLLVVAVVLAAFFARFFALTAQDRVIRLELRLRMQSLAPQLMSRFDELTPRQFTALRFASDAELPGLAQQVLEGKLTKGADIKRQIKQWRADELRV